MDSNHFSCICFICQIKWFVCLNCPKQYTHYSKQKQLKRHQISCTSNTEVTKVNYCDSSKFTFSHAKFTTFKNFGSNKSKEFYYQNQFNYGPAYVVGWSQFHLPNTNSFLAEEEITVQIRILDLMLGLFPKQALQFFNIIQYFDGKIKLSLHQNKWSC